MTSVKTLLVLAIAASSLGNTTRTLPEYEITVRSLPQSIELTCAKGCAWTKLSFEARPDAAPVAIDYYGMTDPSGVSKSPFVLTVAHNATHVRLTSNKGSAWKKLEIECRNQGSEARIDQNGTAYRD